MLDYALRTNNYHRSQQAQIRSVIGGMSKEEKQHMLDTLTLHHSVSNITNQPVNTKLLEYTERLLKGGNDA